MHIFQTQVIQSYAFLCTNSAPMAAAHRGLENFITKTSPCNEDPLTTRFKIVKVGFTGVCIIMPPNFEQVGDILVSACPCVCLCVCVGGGGGLRDIVLKHHVWIPHGKIADAYF